MADAELFRFEMDRLLAYDDDSIVAELRRVASVLPAGPMTREAFNATARMSDATVRKRFGGWVNALEHAGLSDRIKKPGTTATSDDVISDLQRIAAATGRNSLTLEDVHAHGYKATVGTINKHFGSLGKALDAAGLESVRHGRRWSEDDYHENMLEVWTHLARAPKQKEMNLAPSRISASAYRRKFGTWVGAKQAFVDRVNADINDTDPEEAPPAQVTHKLRAARTQKRQEEQPDIRVGLRYQVLRRDNFKCVLCGRSPATDQAVILHIDHILAFSRGGMTRIDNLRTTCQDCNLGKGTSD